MNIHVICGVVSVILQRRRIEGKKPNSGDAEVLQVIQLLSQSGEIADTIIIAVKEGSDMDLINDRVFVPERIVFEWKNLEVAHGLVFEFRSPGIIRGTVAVIT